MRSQGLTNREADKALFIGGGWACVCHFGCKPRCCTFLVPTRTTRGAKRAPMSLFGTWQGLTNIQTIDDVTGYYNIEQVTWAAFEAQIGQAGGDIRLLAALPATAIVAGCNAAILPTGIGLNPIQAAQVGLAWRLARRVMSHRAGRNEEDHEDEDPWAPAPVSTDPPGGTGVPGAAPSSGGVKERVLKMNALIDQTDDSELLPPKASDVTAWTGNYVAVLGAMPEESEEPTPSQLAALFKRVIANDQAPYVDFGVWGPYERKMSKSQKCRIYVPLGDGTYLQRELPGSSTFAAWKAAWNVFRTACLMLNVVSLAALENYVRFVEKLAIQWPQCWGLIYQADDAARAERLERHRRRLSGEAARGRQVPVDWDPLRPWSCLFNELTRDAAYWAERVHHAAAAWVASGSRGSPTVASEAAIMAAVHGGTEAPRGDWDDAASRKRQANRDRKQAKKKRFQSEREELQRFRQGTGAGETKGHKGKSGGKGKSKDQAGSEICFSWASGVGSCAQIPVGGECAGSVKRVRKCRICLSPSHRDADCPKKG